MDKKFRTIWFITIAAVLLLVLVILLQTNKTTPPTVDNPTQQVDAPVTQLGTKLQLVSLLAPSADVKTAMDTNYAPYLTPQLLAAWEAHPSTALGREVSSPWPDRIEITSTTKNTDDSYTVRGNVVEITSNEQEHGGIADMYPVTFTVSNVNGTWHISGYAKN